MKYISSRLSKGNLLFPTEIILDDVGITIKKGGLFKSEIKQFDFSHISSIELNNPRFGFSTISLNVAGTKMIMHGFKKHHVDMIKESINKGKAAL
jgi:hypothetical protein